MKQEAPRLTLQQFRIMASLIGKPRHGYDVHVRTEISLPTVYRAFKVMVKMGYIQEEPDVKQEKPNGGSSKKFYSLTEQGNTVVWKEINLVRRLLEESRSGQNRSGVQRRDAQNDLHP